MFERKINDAYIILDSEPNRKVIRFNGDRFHSFSSCVKGYKSLIYEFWSSKNNIKLKGLKSYEIYVDVVNCLQEGERTIGLIPRAQEEKTRRSSHQRNLCTNE